MDQSIGRFYLNLKEILKDFKVAEPLSPCFVVMNNNNIKFQWSYHKILMWIALIFQFILWVIEQFNVNSFHLFSN